MFRTVASITALVAGTTASFAQAAPTVSEQINSAITAQSSILTSNTPLLIGIAGTFALIGLAVKVLGKAK